MDHVFSFPLNPSDCPVRLKGEFTEHTHGKAIELAVSVTSSNGHPQGETILMHVMENVHLEDDFVLGLGMQTVFDEPASLVVRVRNLDANSVKVIYFTLEWLVSCDDNGCLVKSADRSSGEPPPDDEPAS